MIFQRQEIGAQDKSHERKSGTAACSKPNLQLSTLTEKTNKLVFTQKGATENYLCIFQVKWIFKPTNKAKPKLNILTHFLEQN